MRAEADIAAEPVTGAFARRTARDFCSVSTHWLAFKNVQSSMARSTTKALRRALRFEGDAASWDQGVPDCYQKSRRSSPPAMA